LPLRHRVEGFLSNVPIRSSPFKALIHNTAKQLAAGNHADDFILGWHLIHKRVETRLIRSAFLVRRHFPEQEYI
jgi:hypothetical protein